MRQFRRSSTLALLLAVTSFAQVISAGKVHVSGRETFVPDGTIIARMAWSYVPSEENNKVFGRDQSFVAGLPNNVQLIVKDSRKYATTGGWGFAQFKDGKSADEAVLKTCFPCHEPAKARDLVFTHYSP